MSRLLTTIPLTFGLRRLCRSLRADPVAVAMAESERDRQGGAGLRERRRSVRRHARHRRDGRSRKRARAARRFVAERGAGVLYCTVPSGASTVMTSDEYCTSAQSRASLLLSLGRRQRIGRRCRARFFSRQGLRGLRMSTRHKLCRRRAAALADPHPGARPARIVLCNHGKVYRSFYRAAKDDYKDFARYSAGQAENGKDFRGRCCAQPVHPMPAARDGTRYRAGQPGQA